MIKVVELTKENEEQYLDQVANLEQIILEAMKKEGREGQLFITGKEDISEYVHSPENTVLVAINENDKVEAATYITQGQKPFTYNDITKYFKYGEKYQQYVKSQYQDEKAYRRDIREIYIIKVEAFEYAKKRILAENPQIRNLQQYLKKEIKENGYHEKSELREKINLYMSEYINSHYGKEIQEKYEKFYWITFQDIKSELKPDGGEIETPKIFQEYEQLLEKGSLKIHEENLDFDVSKYYTSKTQNSIELDTYLTEPQTRRAGIARIIVYEGIKKHMEEHFKNPENQEIFLCSTLHRDNLSSKYVSEFFGLTDSLYVNRRQGRDREVHICRIPREQAMEYLTNMSDKLAVLYGYNPNNKKISNSTRKKILQEQLNYELKEHKRLVKARTVDKKLKGINVRFIGGKLKKIRRLQQQLNQLDESEKDVTTSK